MGGGGCRCCTNTTRDFALKVNSGEKEKKNPLPQQGIKPASVLHLAFRSDVLPTELSRLINQYIFFYANTTSGRHLYVM